MKQAKYYTGWVVALMTAAAVATEPNTWTKLDKATIEGRRWDIPLGYDAFAKRFMVLGGRSTWADYKKPRSYDVLTLDAKSGRWENNYPSGYAWGPAFGPCEAPPWKDEYFRFTDAKGNTRPNWTVYGTFSLGQKYDYDPDTKAFYFYAGGHTFRYDPAGRTWTDLAPKTHPEKESGGILLWGSMCYDRKNKQFVLFGGGNIQTPRGDPGTWIYSPAGNTWTQRKTTVQPPQRANSRLVYDPVNEKVVLFGGDQLDQLLSDTWTFDGSAHLWEQCKVPTSPAPRAGHAMLWLPRAKKVLMLGGYGYTSTTGYVENLYRRLPLEAWAFDLAARRWELVRYFGVGRDQPEGPNNFFLSAAVDEEDNIVVQGTNGTWTCRIDANRADGDATAKYGVKPGTVERRTGPHDPAWYTQGVPAAEPGAVIAALNALPANRWVQRPTPKLPRPNMDWGSAVFVPERDQIVRFSGGHSAYSGTAPQVYDVKTDRYTIPFAPELPIEYVYSNDQVRGEWSFQGRPWMTGHTYKSTGHDVNVKGLVFAPHEYTYFFDSLTGKWTRSVEKNPYRPNFYVVTLCSTPKGAVVWAEQRNGGVGLWRLTAARTWEALPLKGTLPAMQADEHGMAYDAKRDRLYLFSGTGKTKGNVTAYDFASGEAKYLDPAGKDRATAPSRETVYLPDLDAVLVGAKAKTGWLLYDCATNAWQAIELPGADPIARGVFNNSMGLMYDPARKLVWAVGQNSHVHVLRLDAPTLKRTLLD